MNAKSFQAKSLEEVQQKISEISELFKPTIAIVFSAVKYDLKALGATFKQHQIDLVGCSSGGEINQLEMMDESIVVMLMDMKKDQYRLYGNETGSNTTYQNAHDIGQFAKSCFDNVSVMVFSGGMTVDGDQIIYGIKDGAQKDIPIYGAMAGDDLEMNRTFAFSQEAVYDNGLMALIIDADKVEMKGLAVSGWEPVGTVNTVTKSEGNVIYEINSQPALDVFNKYFGFKQYDGVGTQLETISGQYPLQIQKENGHTVLRSPLMIDEKNHSLILGGGVKEGSEFRFSTSPSFDVIEQTVDEFKTLKEDLPDVDALILISCKGRQTAFGPMLEGELEGIEDYWGAPMVGFFSFGEIGKVKNGTCELHNVTSTLVGFKEVKEA